MNEFDYVIVGAGSSGCAVAGRLAAAGRFRVLLLEAGPGDHKPSLQMPIGYGLSYYNPRVNWMYQTAPVPGLDNRTIYQPRGKVVGGSSSINAMVYSRGLPSDYDGWEAKGNPGWGWRDVLAGYKRMEDHALGAGEWHGTGGPVHVSDIQRQVHPLTHRFVEAGREMGLDYNPDLNGSTIEGVGYYQLTTKGGFRVSAARAFLWPALARCQITVRREALVTRIMLEGRRAVGIEYRKGGMTHVARAAGEVIVCGGAINSPQLLQLSGIGPGALLQDLGIPVVHDSPAVGRHLQDHLCYDHAYRSKLPSLNEELLPWLGKVKVALRYALTLRGPLSLSVNQGGGFFKSRHDVADPDIQLYFSPLSYEKALPGVRALMKPDPFPGFLTSVSPCRPTSRGTVNIKSNSPTDAPVIAPNYLATDEDVATLLAGARFLRRLAIAPAMRALIAEELKPGPGCLDDDGLVEDMRKRAYSVFHPCGTCRMGPEPADAVVDARLRVHGIERLRVIDASIFPTVPSGNTNAPAMMVGMKGAELILAGCPEGR